MSAVSYGENFKGYCKASGGAILAELYFLFAKACCDSKYVVFCGFLIERSNNDFSSDEF